MRKLRGNMRGLWGRKRINEKDGIRRRQTIRDSISQNKLRVAWWGGQVERGWMGYGHWGVYVLW